jgi:hypothetical protein
MAETSPRIPRLVDPPREIPPGLRLKILAPYDVTASTMCSVPAAVLLVTAAVGNPPTAWRIGLVVVGSLLLLLALKTALPGLVRAMGTLRRMRHGFLTVGRIVSCHLIWDKKRSEMPYQEFLENWVLNVGRSEMAKATGCFTTLFVWIFLVPMVLFIIMVLIVVSLASLKVPGGIAMSGDLDVAYVVKFALTGLAFVIGTLFIVRLFRRGMVDEVKSYMEWRQLAAPGPDDMYDEHAKRLVADARKRGEQISLKAPLPEDSSSAVNLICKVEYSVMNTPCFAAARARLCRRLDPAGVELLIFDPARRGDVDLLVGLPQEVQVDPLGQWKDTPPLASGLPLAITGTVTAIALVALAVNVAQLSELDLVRFL